MTKSYMLFNVKVDLMNAIMILMDIVCKSEKYRTELCSKDILCKDHIRLDLHV